MLHKSPQYCNDKRQGIRARISLLNAYESNRERKIAFGGTLTVSSRGSPQRISANEQTINPPPRKIKREKARERGKEGGEGKGGKREMRKISSVAQCDSLQTRSRSFSLSPSSRFADTHVFSSCLPIENRVGDQIEFPTSTSFYSLRARAIESGRGKNLTGFSALGRCARGAITEQRRLYFIRSYDFLHCRLCFSLHALCL